MLRSAAVVVVLALIGVAVAQTDPCLKRFSDNFYQYQVYPGCQKWVSWGTSLSNGCTSLHLYGSNDLNGVWCNNTATAGSICRALAAKQSFSADCNGRRWTVNPNCGTSQVELAVVTDIESRCICHFGHILRPCLANLNWGAMNAPSCGGVSQTMTVDAWSCEPTPPSVCGNGVVEAGETCDPPSACCNSTCQFSSSQTMCRAAKGVCDEPEYCSGASAACPADVLSPATKTCGENIGFCDARIPNTCTGASPYCQGVPFVNLGSEIPTVRYETSWENYDVISFGDFVADSGEVEGRLAVRNNLRVGVLGAGFSIGRSIDTTDSGKDTYLPFAVVVGGNASWADGSVWPDGSGSPNPSEVEDMYVAGTFTGPDYLRSRILGTDAMSSQTATQSLDAAKTFYTRLQNKFAAGTANAQARSQWGGVFITCNSLTDNFYYVNIDAADISASTWWNLENCNFQSYFVLNVVGSGDVIFQGGDFPTITERLIFNVVGSGRTIKATTGIKGNVLAPQNSFEQRNGVTRGLVLVGDVTYALHSASPNCKHFDPVTITGKAAHAIVVSPKRQVVSETMIQVYSYGILAIGDSLHFGNEVVTLVRTQEIRGRSYIVVSPALTQSYPINTPFYAVVADPASATRTPIPAPISSTDQPTPDATSFQWESVAVQTQVAAIFSVVLVVIAALF